MIFSNCSVWAQQLRHVASLLCGMWNLPGSGIEPVSPALADGFLSTALLEKSTCFTIFNCMAFYDVNILS